MKAIRAMAPMLAAGIDRGNIFAAHLAMLKPETGENDANTQREYGELAANRPIFLFLLLLFITCY
jgi:hypothetical protein